MPPVDGLVGSPAKVAFRAHAEGLGLLDRLPAHYASPEEAACAAPSRRAGERESARASESESESEGSPRSFHRG